MKSLKTEAQRISALYNEAETEKSGMNAWSYIIIVVIIIRLMRN